VATGPTRRGEQIPPSSFAQSSDSDNAGKLFRERRGKEEMTTAESERIPDPTAVIKNNAKPK
jgi:hypothetical protein